MNASAFPPSASSTSAPAEASAHASSIATVCSPARSSSIGQLAVALASSQYPRL
ncbi:MAG: hypothetical protein IPJ77_02060 [Planctomycetes bacterium]|nr:hypothetical protein [Planctomycetota bacterium]